MPRVIVMIVLGIGVLLATSESSGAADAHPLEEVEVTADRMTEAERRAPTTFSSVIDVQSREVPIETTADVLSETVGVQVQRFGGLGAFSTISIRGSSANQVPVYLDGVPLSQAQDQTVNLADLPIDSIERIEVYRGTVPVGFGGGGIGGVVNLVTRPPGEEPRTELTVGYGSFDTRKVVATHTRKIGSTGLLAHVSYLGSNGDFTYFDDNGTDDNLTDDATTTRISNAFDAIDGLVKVTHDFGAGLAGDAVQEVFVKSQGVPGPATTQFAAPSLRTVRSLSYLRLHQAGLAGGTIDTSATLFGVYGKQEFSDPDADFGVQLDTRNQTALVGGSLSGTWSAPYRQSVSWFTELGYEQFFPYNAVANPPPQHGPDQSRLRVTLALQDEIALLTDRVALVPSVRYDHFHDDFSGVNLANMPNSPAQASALDLWTPSIGSYARVASWLTVRGNFGRFQRAPNFSELFGNTGSVRGDANLDPETGINRDVGFVLSWPRQWWFGDGKLEYSYFHNNVDDLIAFVQVRSGLFRPKNIGDARLVGDEVSLKASALEHLGLDMNYTYLDAQNGSIDSPEGNQLPLRPKHELFVRPRLYTDWGSVYYEYTYLSENPTDVDNFLIVPPRSIHSLGCAVEPWPWLSVRFEVTNVTDSDVRDAGNFPLPGRSFFGSVKAVF